MRFSGTTRIHDLSAGTVLQWLALEYLFEERSFRFFDLRKANRSTRNYLPLTAFSVRMFFFCAAIYVTNFCCIAKKRLMISVNPPVTHFISSV